MEVNFETSLCTCLKPVLTEIQNGEQTQQISLPDAMPDVGRVLGAWGQALLRGKEWLGSTVSCTGGMMVWVLYAPEDGSREQCLETWIPFQMKWELPEGTGEGDLRIRCLSRFVDARSVSARKILVRAGMGALAEAYCPMEAACCLPQQPQGDVQLLRREYPIRLPKEMGEKAFSLDEELRLPESAPAMEKLIYCRMEPVVADKKVLSEKVVFRGQARLHTLYRSTEGQLHSWDFALPFSQFGELEQEHGPDAQTDITLMPTNLEVELEEGRLRCKAGLAAQYLVTDREKICLIEDAYSPTRELTLQTQTLGLPGILDSRREVLYVEQTVPVEGNLAADVCVLPDFPRQRRTEDALTLEVPAAVQLLYYGQDGSLQGASSRWEGSHTLRAGSNAQILSSLWPQEEAQAQVGASEVTVKQELPMEVTAYAWEELTMVSGLELGEQRKPDPNRPSLILRRIGDDRLWDVAKESHSTVEAIRRANGLTEEPAPNQMLLIPVGI